MFYNNTLFGVTKAGENIDDYTGLFGITVGDRDDRERTVMCKDYTMGTITKTTVGDEGLLNHIYAITNKEGDVTVESTSFFSNSKKQKMNGIAYGDIQPYNSKHTKYYLQLILKKNRRTK